MASIPAAAETAATGYLQQLSSQKPELAEDCKQLEGFFKQRFWHETTNVLLKVILKPEWDNVDLLLSLYADFVKHFQLKINPFSLSKVVLIATGKVTDHAKAVALLEEIIESLTEPTHVEAVLLLRCEEAIRRVGLCGSQADNTEEKVRAKELIEQAESHLSKRAASSVHPDLRAHLYLAQGAVARLEGKHDVFYTKSLLYIAHIDTDTIPLAQQQELAFNLGIAALLGKTVHNFGELINHPIIESLSKGNHGWLAELLRFFNVGSAEGYDKVTKEHTAELKQFIGDDNARFLQQKLQLMSLLYLLFHTPVHNRTLSFSLIKEKCNLAKLDDVEPLLLRALALGLIRGTIDEVAQTTEVTWIAARALGQDEVGGLVNHMTSWIKQANTLHSETASILGQYEVEG